MISIISPVFNEEENLKLLYDKIKESMDSSDIEWELILVNDGSTDSSAEKLDAIADLDARVKIVHFRRNYGQTAAMMAGIDFSKGEIIVPIDADLQNDPNDITKLVKMLDKGFDVCSGWRQDRKDNPIQRNFLSRVANKLISKVSGLHLHDYGCSLKAYKAEVLKGVKLYGEMHRFIPIYASWLGAKVTEVPVSHYPRMHGESKYGLNRIFKVLLDLLVVKFFDKYSKKPIYVFGGFALINLLCFIVSVFTMLILKVFYAVSFISTPLPVVISMTFIAFGTSLLLGLLAEMLTRTWHESQSNKIYKIRSLRNLSCAE